MSRLLAFLRRHIEVSAIVPALLVLLAYIGQSAVTNELFNGSIDEFLFSNVARYTSNFTPPTAPFALV